jgi:hypothetical protein
VNRYKNGKLIERNYKKSKLIQRNFKDGELISKKCWDKKGKEIDCPK